jgi:hypothetical protein
MSLSKSAAALWLVLAAVACSTAGAGKAGAAEVCAPRAGQPLRFVDLFDGAVADQAKLMPDVAEERSGHWQLGYVYDAGRFVTVRCKYADGQAVDIRLDAKVQACRYRLEADKTLKLSCQ